MKKGLRLETSALLTVFLEVRKHLHNNGRFMAFNSCNNNKVLLTFNDVTLNETCELKPKTFSKGESGEISLSNENNVQMHFALALFRLWSIVYY